MTDDSLTVLPLAITMMAGPQFVSALILITTARAVPTSLAFVAGVATAATTGTALTTWLAGLLPPDPLVSDSDGSLYTLIQYVLVAILVGIAIWNWTHRETAEPPKWLGSLMSAGPGRGFRTGFLLIAFFPSDVVVMCVVGLNLARSGAGFSAAIPFLLTTTLIAALPLLAYLLFRRRAARVMPEIRDWTNDHGWLLNIVASLFFVVLILF
ncbi:GAP family protein [Amycolatopsis decaplanina]|uniref:GAP family protein n=1 Tax=Amycolatopsis decaplanina DSM 44594 TaxID=1284240 RepID=M2XYI7_9PSEU|nr:GAP family protein [Amycolatopsis decaplanina]EME54230.1 hypothetical protein H074_29823 [Amycolatopsis decaplanina DSM 44594]